MAVVIVSGKEYEVIDSKMHSNGFDVVEVCTIKHENDVRYWISSDTNSQGYNTGSHKKAIEIKDEMLK